MVPLKLISLLREPVTIRTSRDDGRKDLGVTLAPSGKTLTIKKGSRDICMVGSLGIVYEYVEIAIGLPKEIDRSIRYVVTMVAWESLQDRKDFVTPIRTIKDTAGIVRAYRQLRGHHKDEVDRFFEEAATSREIRT